MRKLKIHIIILLITTLGCNTDTKPIDDIDISSDLINLSHEEKIIYLDSILNTNKSEKVKAIALFEKTQVLSKLQEYNKVIPNCTKALEVFKAYNSKKYLAKAYWLLGTTNTFLHKKELAIKQLLIALNNSEELENKSFKAKVFSSLSHGYFLYNDFEKAIDYSLKASEIHTIEKDTLSLSVTYNNLAIIYRNIRNYQKAITYNVKSLDINLLKKDTISIAKSYNNLGLVLEQTASYKKALDYYHKAIELNKKANRLNSKPLENLGNYYFKLNDFKKAKKYYLEALEIENKKESVAVKKELYNALLHISLNSKEFENSIYYKKKRDSLYKIQSALDLKEKLDLVENQYQLAAKEKDLKQAKNNLKKNTVIFISITALLVILSLLWFLYIKTKILKNQKEKVILEQKILRSQMNPHFIFNALSNIQTSILKKENMKAVGYLSKFSKLVRNILENSSLKAVSFSTALNAINDYLELQKIRFESELNYTITVDKTIETELIYIPPMLFQPLVENAIEHGISDIEDGHIKINFKNNRNSIKCTVIDNGVGFSKTKKNTNKSKKSLSTQIIKNRLEILSKELNYNFQSKIESLNNTNGNTIGTKATIDIPIVTNKNS